MQILDLDPVPLGHNLSVLRGGLLDGPLENLVDDRRMVGREDSTGKPGRRELTRIRRLGTLRRRGGVVAGGFTLLGGGRYRSLAMRVRC